MNKKWIYTELTGLLFTAAGFWFMRQLYRLTNYGLAGVLFGCVRSQRVGDREGAHPALSGVGRDRAALFGKVHEVFVRRQNRRAVGDDPELFGVERPLRTRRRGV